MSALVPYVGGLALRAGIRPGLRLAPSVVRGIGTAMRYGRAATVIGRAARSYLGKRKFRTIRRAYKSSKKQRLFSKTHVGENIGATSCKSVEIVSTDLQPKDTRTLYSASVCRIPQGTEINERLRKHVNLRGFKVCFELLNTQPTPMYFNIAVVAPKNTTNQNVDNNKFFRDTSTDRARDFGNGLTGLEFHCLPINTDDYTVLKHKRFRLGPVGSNPEIAENVTNNYKNVDWYIPLKRQVRYTNAEDNKPTDGDVYVVYWCDKMFAASGDTPSTAAVGVTQRYITYFREPKN